MSVGAVIVDVEGAEGNVHIKGTMIPTAPVFIAAVHVTKKIKWKDTGNRNSSPNWQTETTHFLLSSWEALLHQANSTALPQPAPLLMNVSWLH